MFLQQVCRSSQADSLPASAWELLHRAVGLVSEFSAKRTRTTFVVLVYMGIPLGFLRRFLQQRSDSNVQLERTVVAA